MRKKIIFLLFIMLIVFNNKLVLAKCIEKCMDVSIENKQIKEENEYVKSNILIPMINIKDNKDLEESISAKIENDIITWKNDLIDLAHKYKEDYSKDNIIFNKFELLTKYDVTYNKNDILSIPIIYYQYTGGAHGLTTKISYNIDLNKNQSICLKNMFKDGSDYQDKINKYIREEISKHQEEYFNNGEDFKGIKENQDFYITNDGIVIYFQVYEIAPYVSGIREFKVPFSLIESDLIYKIN